MMFEDMSEAQFADIIGRVKGIAPEVAKQVSAEFYANKARVPVVINGPSGKEISYRVMLWAVNRAKELDRAA